jgi:hypothetical protein
VNQWTGTELVDVQNNVDQTQESLLQIVRAPVLRRVTQQVAYAIWEKHSVEIVPGVTK